MATNFASASYQEIIDLHTESDKVSVIGIHTPQGSKPRAMLEGFFKQFRKYKYNGCSLVMVPAARLPADPLGVSYEAGEPGSDPRDLLNPILFHGCHGDNLNAALNTIYKGSFDLESSSIGLDEFGADVIPAESIDWEAHYYRALSDRSFQKSNIMSAFRKKGLHPLVYNVASNHQILPNENNAAVGALKLDTTDNEWGFNPAIGGKVSKGAAGSAQPITPQFMTNRLQSLGWMDTRQVLNSLPGTDVTPAPTVLPKIFMGIMMLPPCYKTEMYFRLVLTHSFSFKEFNTSLSLPGAVDYHDWNNTGEAKKREDPQPNISGSLELVNSGAEVVTEGVF